MIRYTLILLIGLVILSSFRLLVITHMAFATRNQKWSRGEDVIVFRRVCDSNSKILLAHALKNFNWCSLYQTESCDHMLAYFMDTLNAMLDYYMPLCPFKRHSSDKPWVTDRFASLSGVDSSPFVCAV